MDTTRGLSSHCRHCRFYTPEGRRGGQCGQLGVSVSGSWQSCSLSLAPFAPSWEVTQLFPDPQRSKMGMEMQSNFVRVTFATSSTEMESRSMGVGQRSEAIQV